MEGGIALGDYASSPESILLQEIILLAEVCPQAADEKGCMEQLPGFWGQISPIIMTSHYQNICHDLEECMSFEKVKC